MMIVQLSRTYFVFIIPISRIQSSVRAKPKSSVTDMSSSIHSYIYKFRNLDKRSHHDRYTMRVSSDLQAH